MAVPAFSRADRSSAVWETPAKRRRPREATGRRKTAGSTTNATVTGVGYLPRDE
ncbi:hypothetical protein [Halostagnicola sp. A56]|uniref:hypothetical protein n=1 Tax=Halostagnicola sp. A56 TaxID=1495067 RepID=UPI0012E1D56F|nr:hypothetical protein [Halostagnicola sp. A56]